MLAALIGSAAPAFATSQSWGPGYTSTRYPVCSYLWTQINDTQGRPYMITHAQMQSTPDLAHSSCWNSGFSAGVGTVSGRQDLFAWNSNVWGNQWVSCNAGPWVYSQGSSPDVWTAFGWGGPPCGAAYYIDDAASFSWCWACSSSGTGEWRGGWKATGDGNGWIWIS